MCSPLLEERTPENFDHTGCRDHTGCWELSIGSATLIDFPSDFFRPMVSFVKSPSAHVGGVRLADFEETINRSE